MECGCPPGTPPTDASPQGSSRVVDVVVGLLLLTTIAAAAGIAFAYVDDDRVQIEGALAGVALGALAVAVGMWARHFMPQGPVEQPRPVLGSSSEERAAVIADLDRGERTVFSRRVLLGLLLGAVGSVGAVALFPLRSLGPDILGDLRSTAWQPGSRVVDANGVAVRTDRLPVGGMLTVFPAGVTEAQRADAQTVLLHVGSGVLQPVEGREDWSPDGFIAFSKVCTHAGCSVGLYQERSHQLICPCHQSVFDVTDAANPVFGPATRPLPQLPLRIEAGELVALDGYDEPVGPAFWSWHPR